MAMTHMADDCLGGGPILNGTQLMLSTMSPMQWSPVLENKQGAIRKEKYIKPW